MGRRYDVRPITRNAAVKWVSTVHRHLKRPVTGWLFGIQLIDRDTGCMVGVAMAGLPKSRVAMQSDPFLLEVNRTCTLGTPNANGSAAHSSAWSTQRCERPADETLHPPLRLP